MGQRLRADILLFVFRESHCVVVVLTQIGGPWLRRPEMLTETANELITWGGKTGWPVSNIAKSLEESASTI